MGRKRRTTVLTGKELDNILDDENFQDEDPFKSVKNEGSLKNYEEVKEGTIEEMQEKVFQASFVTPPEENDFDDDSARVDSVLGLASSRKRMTVQRKKTLTKEVDHEDQEMDDKDILDQLVQADKSQKFANQTFEQNVDELMENFEVIHEKRARGTEVAAASQELSMNNVSFDDRKTEVGAQAQKVQKKQNARFSIQFDDKELKNQLVQTHSIYRKFQKKNDSSIGSLSQPQNQETDPLNQDENNYDKEPSNDNSLATEEDLDNYLEELADQERIRRESHKVMESGKFSKMLQEEEKQQNIEQHFQKEKQNINNSKISSGKDMIEVIEEMEEEDDFMSDDSFTKEFYQTMHQDVLMKGLSDSEKRESQQIQDLTKDDWDYKDLLKIIDWNERRHQDVAKEKLKKNAELSIKNTSSNTSEVKMRIFTSFQTLNSVSNKIIKEKQFSQATATCVALSDDLLFVGNSEGQVWMFDREAEDEYSTFSEKSKEFLGNSVTCIDVHPLRTEYVVLGYERGQLVMFDATEPNKSIKVIKDHHKNVPVINIKFCDWQTSSQNQEQGPEKQSWLFVSIDKQGKVLINSISKVLFVMKSSKHVVIDPAKYQGPLFSSIACRFHSQMHGTGIYDDMSFVALGNTESVVIMEARPSNHTEFITHIRPDKFYNRSKNSVENFKPQVPSLSWGHGMTPVLKDRPHSILAIAWGPLIELVVLIDHEDTDKPFITDGYYILKYIDSAQQNSFSPQPKGSVSRRSVRFHDPAEQVKQIKFQEDKEELKEQLELDLEINDDEKPKEVKYDDSVGFNKPELFIEHIYFLSDSTLLVLTRNQEIRVLYTQGFSPDSYSHDKAQKKSALKKDPSRQTELESGIRVANLLKSNLGSPYHQTIKFFSGKMVALTQKIVMTCSHLTWQQSIYEFKKQVEDDLIQVFSRALNIYKGKVKGYSGLPDNAYLRENFLKAELKLLVKEIIYQVIEKTKVINDRRVTQTYNSASGVIEGGKKEQIQNTLQKLEQYEDERKKKFETLIRIAIEFCVELKDCDFLFKDLFWLFQEEKLEELFVQELEPFIMAGRFQEWELPNDVIQNHVIRYYKDPAKAEALEKIIVNLNLNQCPKTIVLEFIHFSEQNYLTTAILFLYTQVFERKDNSSCVQVLFSLFDLYKKANKRNQASLIDLTTLKEATYDSQDKRQIEKSQIYLGYKILWVIRLFLNGKKFPQGNIREKKWRCYIHDIIQFLSNLEIMKVLLDIDAETLFQTIAILFYPSKPFELVQSGRDDTVVNPNLLSQTHIEFINDFHAYCLSKEAPEHVRNEYLFFVANVVAKSKIQGLNADFYYAITRELLTVQKRYLEFNKNIQDMANRKKRKLNERLSENGDNHKTFKELDEKKYIHKTESDFIILMRKSEPLDSIQIQEFLKLTELTQFDLVKLFLLEKQEQYIKCLAMLLSAFKQNEIYTAEQQGEKVISWILEKIKLLEERSVKSIQDKNIFEQFKREVAQNIKKIVVLNPKETIKLVDERFGSNHKEMIDSLNRDPIEQMLYLETLLDEQEQTIQETIKRYGLESTNKEEAKRYIEFLKLHLRLCCQHNTQNVLSIVEKMVKNSYYPIEDCLQICQEFKQIEAAFLLNKKLGKYFDSVQQGIELIKTKVDLTKLKIELYFAQKNCISTNFVITNDQLVSSAFFDSIFKKILKICSKNSKEVEHDKEELIWYIVIDALLEMRSNEIVAGKTFCKQFFSERLNIFVEAMSQDISFQKFLDHILQKYKNIQFKDFRSIILQMFGNHVSEKVVLSNANNAIFKVNSALFQTFSQQTRCGFLFRSRICFLCKRYMDSFLYDSDLSTHEDNYQSDEDEEEVYFYDSQKEVAKIFACRHTFHVRCLKKHYKSKTSEAEDIFNKKSERLRCPTCHIKSFEIESEKGVKGGRGGLQKAQTSEQKLKQAALESEEDAYERKLQKRHTRMTLKSQSLVNRQLVKLQKQMQFYDSQTESDWLNINDFRLI